ncbi:geranylgeranyl reductase family protein [soil metagenome]
MSLNNDLAALPPTCEVLVVGAGPAGSAVARTLALAGMDVVIVDQHAFPRDKVCGDALIPDAHAALRKLGMLDAVMAQAQHVAHVGCIAPRGGRVDVPGTLAVMPRKQLDDILVRGAVDAGARLYAPARFMAPIEIDGRVVGARIQAHDTTMPATGASEGPTTRELRAQWVVLASGAVPQALMAAGMCERQTPSGVALRGYVRNESMAPRIKSVEVVWHRALSPGYGWIFPCRDGVFNIGVGLSHSHDKPGKSAGRSIKKEVNLREVFDAFTRFYEPARDLMATGTLLGALKGAPLRCTLQGARFTRPGLLVTGEAAGSTYSFTGEGIGKALETGTLAAEAILSGRHGHSGGGEVASAANDAVLHRYEAGLMALKPRFDLYERANRVNQHPWLSDLLIWRARKNARVLRRMSGVLEETSNPGTLVSLRGIVRLFGK